LRLNWFNLIQYKMQTENPLQFEEDFWYQFYFIIFLFFVRRPLQPGHTLLLDEFYSAFCSIPMYVSGSSNTHEQIQYADYSSDF